MKYLILSLFLSLSVAFGQTANKPVMKTGSSDGNLLQGALNIGTAGPVTFNADGTLTWTTGATFAGDEADFRAEIGAGTGSGTVTSMSVVTANGLSGTVATATTTPAITLNISGLDAAKIGSGDVSTVEWEYLKNVTSDIQTQFSGKIGGSTGATDDSILRANGTGGITAQGTGANATLTDDGLLTLGSGIITTSLNGTIYASNHVRSTAASDGDYVEIDGITRNIEVFDGTSAYTGEMLFPSLSTEPNWTFPDLTGTVMVDTFGTVNVKVYGAKGDARKVTDAVLNGTTTVTSATANFTNADIGKQVWGCNSSTGVANLARTTIVSVTNSTTIEVAVAAGSSQTGIHLVIGTDDTAAIKAAAAAADAMIPKGTIYCPTGGYVFDETPFVFTSEFMAKKASVLGDGSSSTFLFPTPDIALTSNTILAYDNIAGSNEISGITVDGSFMTTTSGNVIWTTSSANYHILDDVRIINFYGTYGVNANGATSLLHCHIESIQGAAGVTTAAAVTMIDTYSGNCGYFSLFLQGGATANVTDGTLDESTSGTVYVGGGSTLIANGALIFTGSAYTGITLDSSSFARLSNCRVIPFGGNTNCTGINIGAGSIAHLSQCTITGNGTGYALNNSGTVYDGGNNTVNSVTGTAMAEGLNSVVGMSHGGLGVALSDPNADRLLFWDDSAGAYDYATLGTGLSFTGTTLNAATGLTVGSTAIASGTDTRILYDNAGVLGEKTTTGSGSVVLADSPTFSTLVTLTSSWDIDLTQAAGATLEFRYSGTPKISIANGFTIIKNDFYHDYCSAIYMSSNGAASRDIAFTFPATNVLALTDGSSGYSSLRLKSITQSAGATLSITSGTNQRAGNVTLVGGTVTVNNTTVTANTIVLLTRKTAGGTTGELTYTTSAATSFTITSASGTDTSTVSYLLIEVP